MANPLHHAISSARRYGGEPEQYRDIHEWFDEPEQWFADFRQRAIRHHSEGIGLACDQFDDVVIELGAGRTRIVPVRFVAEQHVREELGRIPTAANWLRCLEPAAWMTRARARYHATLNVRACKPSTPVDASHGREPVVSCEWVGEGHGAPACTPEGSRPCGPPPLSGGRPLRSLSRGSSLRALADARVGPPLGRLTRTMTTTRTTASGTTDHAPTSRGRVPRLDEAVEARQRGAAPVRQYDTCAGKKRRPVGTC